MEAGLTTLDYAIVGFYLVFALSLGFLLGRRASQSLAHYFGAGRELPWWLAGTSMVATTFASDTPLAVSGLVRKQGIAGNWFWWNIAIANLLGTFLFAPLWRRSGALTDLEFIALRYDGHGAALLRGFRVLYTSLLANSIVIGWVIHAMVKIVQTTFGWEPTTTLTTLILIAFIYTFLAGLWGVVMTDFLQFALAMTGAIWLSVASLNAVGGTLALVERLHDAGLSDRLAFFPSPQNPDLWGAFLAYLLVQWWAVGRPDGEGAIAQRLLATRDERNAVLSFLWFSFAHYVLRPWWWMLVALASLILIPEPPKGVGDEGVYPMMIVRLLPAGVMGLMVASLIGAFMSTIDTQLNWAASYLVNDFYRPFIKRDADERHYVLVGRVATLLVLLLGVGASFVTEGISEAWMVLAGLNAGIGGVSILRWLWWRINAWSEISAMAAALSVNAVVFGLGWSKVAPFDFLASQEGYPYRLLLIVPVVQGAWILTTLLTPPEPMERLVSFYRKVRPPGRWKPVAQRAGLSPDPLDWRWVLGWIGGIAFIYGGLLSLGGLLLLQWKWLFVGGIAVLLGLLGIRLGLNAVFERPRMGG